MSSFVFQFYDVPLWTARTSLGHSLNLCRQSGEAMIDFDDEDNWSVDWIRIEGDLDGRKTQMIECLPNNPLHPMMATALRKHSAEDIVAEAERLDPQPIGDPWRDERIDAHRAGVTVGRHL